jgi:hypothetical protein
MSGFIPSFIEKGKEVLYEEMPRKVIDYYFSCPCAIGDTHHHPSEDLLMVNLEDIGEKPYSSETFKPMV